MRSEPMIRFSPRRRAVHKRLNASTGHRMHAAHVAPEPRRPTTRTTGRTRVAAPQGRLVPGPCRCRVFLSDAPATSQPVIAGARRVAVPSTGIEGTEGSSHRAADGVRDHRVQHHRVRHSRYRLCGVRSALPRAGTAQPTPHLQSTRTHIRCCVYRTVDLAVDACVCVRRRDHRVHRGAHRHAGSRFRTQRRSLLQAFHDHTPRARDALTHGAFGRPLHGNTPTSLTCRRRAATIDPGTRVAPGSRTVLRTCHDLAFVPTPAPTTVFPNHGREGGASGIHAWNQTCRG